MNSRAFPSIERLEDRIAPSGLITVSYAGGHLALAGDAGDHSLGIEFADPSTLVLRAFDGTSLVVNGKAQTSPVSIAAFAGNVEATLGGGRDTIQIGPGMFPGDVSIDLGGGENRLIAGDLTVAGNLSVTGAAGADHVAFAGKATTIGGDASLELGDGANEVAAGLGAFLVGRNLGVKTGRGSDSLVFGGTGFAIGGDTTVTSGAGSDVVGFFATKIGLFGGKLSVAGSSGAGQAERFTFSGDEQILFHGAIAITTGDGNGAVALQSGGRLHAQSDLSIDTNHGSHRAHVTAKDVTVDGSVSVTSRGSVDLKVAATDNLNIGGNVRIAGGSGADHVMIAGGGKIAGAVSVDVGAGNHQSITLAGTSEQPLVTQGDVTLIQGGAGGTNTTTILNSEFGSSFVLKSNSPRDTIKLASVLFDGGSILGTAAAANPFDLGHLAITPAGLVSNPLDSLVTVPRSLAAIIATEGAHLPSAAAGSVLDSAGTVDLTSHGLTSDSYQRLLGPLSVETAL